MYLVTYTRSRPYARLRQPDDTAVQHDDPRCLDRTCRSSTYNHLRQSDQRVYQKQIRIHNADDIVRGRGHGRCVRAVAVYSLFDLLTLSGTSSSTQREDPSTLQNKFLVGYQGWSVRFDSLLASTSISDTLKFL